MDEWIKIEERLPPLPQNVVVKYLVLIKRNDSFHIKIAKWMKQLLHREAKSFEAYNKQLLRSEKADWRVANFKSKEIIAWMPLPAKPEENENVDS